MAKGRKVIITCAVTGSIHTPSMSPHLPITAEEIADAAVGAVIRHLRSRLRGLQQPVPRRDAALVHVVVMNPSVEVTMNKLASLSPLFLTTA